MFNIYARSLFTATRITPRHTPAPAPNIAPEKRTRWRGFEQ